MAIMIVPFSVPARPEGGTITVIPSGSVCAKGMVIMTIPSDRRLQFPHVASDDGE
jgi:hypothetical protein